MIRRLTLGLTGLPPTVNEINRFIADKEPKAYERLVERLLEKPAYGERWGRHWLDSARFGESDGFERNNPRNNLWPFRDWVIKALNEDMPFDQFSIEQLAGDMLPNATSGQIVATGFHRNTMLNEEGGIDPLEFRYYAAVDRVATTGTVWMGLSTGCAQCHTHKYDPITHDEYYQMMALLDNVEEPDFLLESEEQAKQKVEIEKQIEQKAISLQKQIEGFDDAFMAWGLRAELERHGITAELEFADIESLNRRTENGLLDLSAISVGAYPIFADRYRILRCGASFGGLAPVCA